MGAVTGIKLNISNISLAVRYAAIHKDISFMVVDSAFCDLNKMAIDIAIVILIYIFIDLIY